MTRPKPTLPVVKIEQAKRSQADCYRAAWERLYKELMTDDQRLIMDNPDHRISTEFAKRVIIEGQSTYDKQPV